jgi:hypothetical protein
MIYIDMSFEGLAMGEEVIDGIHHHDSIFRHDRTVS